MANEKPDQALTSGHAREAIDAATSWAGEHDGSQAGNVSGDARETSQKAGAQEGQGGNPGFSSANPPNAPSGLSTPLQPGGVSPGASPGASVGSVGTGGGQTPDEDVSPMHDGP